MNSVSTIEAHGQTRIFARQMARELSAAEVTGVSGGRMSTMCNVDMTGPWIWNTERETDDC